MPEQKIKSIRLIVTRLEIERVIRDIIALGCVEFTEPDELTGDPEISALTTRVEIDLSRFNLEQEGAGPDTLVALGTQATLILTGWVSTRSVPELTARLGYYTCAWEIEDPSAETLHDVPVILTAPGFFGKLRMKNQRLFTPLTTSKKFSAIPQEPAPEESDIQTDAAIEEEPDSEDEFDI